MSVYHEALKSGRLRIADVVNAGGSHRRALRIIKRHEADERNASTPYERTKRARREAATHG